MIKKVYHTFRRKANGPLLSDLSDRSFLILDAETNGRIKEMMDWIRYRMLMRRLRGEIAVVVNGKQKPQRAEKMKTAGLTACKPCESIV